LLPSDTASEIVKAYVNAKAGDGLNLSQEEMDPFQATIRQVLTGRSNEYRKKILKGISTVHIAEAPRVGRITNLLERNFWRRQARRNLSKISLPPFSDTWPTIPSRVQESFCWINFKLDGIPTIALFH
jgi:hypothetical protein